MCKKKQKVDEAALFNLIASDAVPDENWQRKKHIFADSKTVAAWYEGLPVYCQPVKSPLDFTSMVADAQLELKKAGAFEELETPNEVLKMPCLNTAKT